MLIAVKEHVAQCYSVACLYVFNSSWTLKELFGTEDKQDGAGLFVERISYAKKNSEIAFHNAIKTKIYSLKH